MWNSETAPVRSRNTRPLTRTWIGLPFRGIQAVSSPLTKPPASRAARKPGKLPTKISSRSRTSSSASVSGSYWSIPSIARFTCSSWPSTLQRQMA